MNAAWESFPRRERVPKITERDEGSVAVDSTGQGTETRSPGRRKKSYVIRRVKRAAAPTSETDSSPVPERAAAESRDAHRPRPVTLSAEERYRAIAEAAYYKAESRGFQGGDPSQDWREAEAEIDAWILGSERGD